MHQAFPNVVCLADRGDRARGVEEHGGAVGTVRAGEHVAQGGRVRLRIAAAQLVRVAALDSQVERVELVLADSAGVDLADEVRPAGESSSMPPAPCTTYARVTSSWTSASASVRTSSGE